MYKFCPFCGAEIKSQKEFGFKCESCHKATYYNSKPTSCVIFVYKDEMLLSIRGIEPQKGKLDIIGGFLNNGEDPEDGAIREVEEEIGLKIKKSQLNYLGMWIDNYQFENTSYKLLNIFYYIILDKKINPSPKDDISEVKWLKIKNSEDYAFKCINSAIKTLKKVHKF